MYRAEGKLSFSYHTTRYVFETPINPLPRDFGQDFIIDYSRSYALLGLLIVLNRDVKVIKSDPSQPIPTREEWERVKGVSID